MVYTPSVEVVVSLACPVAVLVTLTVAPGSTPFWLSVTVPWIVLLNWALAGVARSTRGTLRNERRQHARRPLVAVIAPSLIVNVHGDIALIPRNSQAITDPLARLGDLRRQPRPTPP